MAESTSSISAPRESLWTPLLDAMRGRKYELADTLLDQILANPEPCNDYNSRNLFNEALISDRVEIYLKICKVIGHSAILDARTLEVMARNNSYHILMHLDDKHPALVRALANPKGILYDPPIHVATQAGSTEVVMILLDYITAETALRYSCYKVSLLTEAAFKGHDDIVELLLEQPYISDLIKVPNANSPLARQYAGDYTALHHAAVKLKYPVFKKLFDAYSLICDPCILPAENNQTVLISMIESRNTISIKQFISDLGSDHPLLTKSDCFGQTPLHKAAAQGLTGIVSILYEIYASRDMLLAVSGGPGHTFLNYLIQYDHSSIIYLLLKRSDFDLRLVSKTDNNGHTPLVHALYKGREEICELLWPYSLASVSISPACNKGVNILMLAVLMNIESAVNLITSDADACNILMISDDDGDTPLHAAIYVSSAEICGLVYDRAPSTEQVYTQTRHYGLTALHLAILYRGVDIIKVLLKDRAKARAMMVIVDADGKTAIDYASMRSPEIVSMLEAVMEA